MNLFTKQKQIHSLRKHIYGYQVGRMRVGIDWDLGIDVYIPLYLEQIINKDLLYSTENSAQYSVVTQMKKELKKEQTHVYV